MIALISLVSYFIFTFYFDYLAITSVGLTFSLYVILRFINQLGKTFPLNELMVLLASLQWVIGAKMSYEYGKNHHRYFMYVEEERYMALVVPAIILLYLGLSLFRVPNLKEKLDMLVQNNSLNKAMINKTAKALLFLGISAFAINRAVSFAPLAFIFFLMTLLIYVSIGYYFYIFPRKRTMIFFIILIFAFLQALSVGLFHNFLFIGIFLFAIYVKKETSFIKKAVIIFTAIVIVNIIQIVKQDFRDIVWKSKSTNRLEVFVQLVEEEFFVTSSDTEILTVGSTKEKDEDVEKVTSRINQGWIISKVLDHVPKYQSYIKGQSVVDAISASFLPRFLFPNKSSGDDAKRTFEKVTGLQLVKGTSMGLSLIGEFYANYGKVGAWLAIFLYGGFISFVLKLLVNYTKQSPFLVLWFVLIFFQVIKAESNLLSVLNHLSKSIIFLIALNYGLSLFFKIKLFYIPKRN